ncbi:MAG: 30S ribosomal protein S17 [Candidatus Nanoarchaeia archaeon]|nr:30S ribosomal protein S17 [Candidatus Nanoarchaeia archaeon]
MKKSVGTDIEFPKETCNDKDCPFHGNVSMRGNTFSGKVISAKMQKTVVVEWSRKEYVKKFERYLVKKTKVKAHNPECLDVKEGDNVLISETRPLSKTKHFVVLKKI